jgi:alpha-beta hydrolase superfamily lysophospholipase
MASFAQVSAGMPPQVYCPDDAYRLGEPIADQHGTIVSADGTNLFYRNWPATNTWSGNVAIVLHGIGYHSGPYKVIAEDLNPRGIDVFALDARGHGLSCGRRGYVGTAQQVAADVGCLVREIKEKRPSANVFLLGDSMGCNYALNYSRHDQQSLAGLILLAPAFYVDKDQLFRLQSLLEMPYLFFAHRRPVIDLVGERLRESTGDSDFATARATDALAYRKVSFGYILDIQRLIWNWKRTIAPRVQLPILMIKGGQDNVVSQDECETFVRLSASSDIHFHVYPDVRHTTLWDPQTPEILDQVGSWILGH